MQDQNESLETQSLRVVRGLTAGLGALQNSLSRLASAVRLKWIAGCLVAAGVAASAPSSVLAACDLTGAVDKGVIVYHGTPVAKFGWRNPELAPPPPFPHPRNPDGPAWFSPGNWQFSIHAGLRFLAGSPGGTLHLFQYTLAQQISVLDCPDHQEFSKQTGIDAIHKLDQDVARAFCAKFPHQYNGYVIRKDRVRGEPELILCDPTQTLKFAGQTDWMVIPINLQDGSKLTGASGTAFDGATHNCLLSNVNLTEFFCSVPK